MRRKGEPGSQQPTMEGRGPRQVNFFYFLPFCFKVHIFVSQHNVALDM